AQTQFCGARAARSSSCKGEDASCVRFAEAACKQAFAVEHCRSPDPIDVREGQATLLILPAGFDLLEVRLGDQVTFSEWIRKDQGGRTTLWVSTLGPEAVVFEVDLE
ncbi:MAG: hypothetical protein HC923_02070, partial [Myxococcales bacterium]|nr:hypothetical protein [Myxococcales bacterium]